MCGCTPSRPGALDDESELDYVAMTRLMETQAATAEGRPIVRNRVGEESTSYISMMSQGEDEVVPAVVVTSCSPIPRS